MSSHPLTRATAEEYLAFERTATEKHDFIDGQIVAMSGGSPAHSLVTYNIGRELGNRLEGMPCQPFSPDLRVCVSRKRLFTYPDVAVVCGQPVYFDESRDTIMNPTLICEVLSPTTRGYDRGERADLYREIPSLREILLVEPGAVHVEHWKRLPNGNWEFATYKQWGMLIKLESLACELSIDRVYSRLDFLNA